jgi:FtsH-binding integral membrane protein
MSSSTPPVPAQPEREPAGPAHRPGQSGATGGPGFPAPAPPHPASPLAPPLITWPRPGNGLAAAALLAVLVAAGIGAATIPSGPPGVGWLIAVLAGVTALSVAAVLARRHRPDLATGSEGEGSAVPAALRVGRLAWAVATVALVGVGTFRSAGWLFTLCLITAGMTATLTVTDGRTLRGLLVSLVLPPVAAVRAVPWVARSVRRPTSWGAGVDVAGLVVSLGVSATLLVVFGSLFASADPAFGAVFDNLTPDVSPGFVIRWPVLFVLIALALLGAAFLLATAPRMDRLEQRRTRRVRTVEWALPVALLDLLFAVFVLVQLTVLFGGSELVLGTPDLTYAQHARDGYWQLLTVSGLTLLVIAGAARRAPRDTSAQRTLLRVLLGVLCLFSLVVVASALFRMNVYADAYGATRLRLLVAASEVWLGLVFVLVMAAGVRLRAPGLPRLVIGLGVLALLGLAVADPDRMIADRNIDRYQRTGRLDLAYLADLSPDAAPAFARLPGPQRRCALAGNAEALHEPVDWRSFNLSRRSARALTEADPALREHDMTCLLRWGR